jgi:hypothetical protein
MGWGWMEGKMRRSRTKKVGVMMEEVTYDESKVEGTMPCSNQSHDECI